MPDRLLASLVKPLLFRLKLTDIGLHLRLTAPNSGAAAAGLRFTHLQHDVTKNTDTSSSTPINVRCEMQ